MAYTTLHATSLHRHSSLAGSILDGIFGLRKRISRSWKLRLEERMLESLPYETLKDIGFPAANHPRGDNAAR